MTRYLRNGRSTSAWTDPSGKVDVGQRACARSESSALIKRISRTCATSETQGSPPRGPFRTKRPIVGSALARAPLVQQRRQTFRSARERAAYNMASTCEHELVGALASEPPTSDFEPKHEH